MAGESGVELRVDFSSQPLWFCDFNEHLKTDGWSPFLLGQQIFRGYVQLQVGKWVMLILSRPLSILISSTCITFPYSTWWSFKQWYARLWFTTFSKPNVVWFKAMTLSPRRVHWQQTMGSITQHQLQRVATGFGLQICLLSKFSSWLDTVDARNPADHVIWE